MNQQNQQVSAERVREVFNYEPETGEFRWRVSLGSRAQKGERAGSHDGYGYIQIRLDGRVYRGHRLAWLYVYGVYPEGDIDHINGERADNRIANLRDVTRSMNLENRRSGTAKSGLIGAHKHAKADGYFSRISVRGKNTYLGYFKTAEEAHQAYLSAKRRLHQGCTI